MLSKPWLLSLPLALGGASAWGDSDFTNMFTYSGFGTAALVTTNTNKATYIETGQTAGATEGLDYKTDSKLGAQLTVAPTEWLSGTAQLLSEQRLNDNLSPQFEWAFIKVKPLRGLSLRAGQMDLPTFMTSDYRNIGYANTWLRAPDEVYGQAIFTTYKGVDMTYQRSLGSSTLTVGALEGKSDVDSYHDPLVLVQQAHALRGYNASWEMGSVTVRASHVQMDVVTMLHGVIIADGPYAFDSVGAIVDRNNVVLQAEFIERHIPKVPTIEVHGWYTLGGYHFGNWLPFAMIAGGERVPGFQSAIPIASVPAEPVPEMHKSTVSVGVRADLFKSVDFKLQIDHVKAFPDGDPFINIQPGFDNSAYVLSIAADFAF